MFKKTRLLSPVQIYNSNFGKARNINPKEDTAFSQFPLLYSEGSKIFYGLKSFRDNFFEILQRNL